MAAADQPEAEDGPERRLRRGRIVRLPPPPPPVVAIITTNPPSSVCAVSIIRAHAVATVSFTDRTYAYASTLIWSAVEVNVGITCACLPVLQPVIHRVFGAVLGTERAKYIADGGGGAAAGAGGSFRRLDEDVVQVQGRAPSHSAWVSASTPEEREVRMNTIHVKRDVDLDRRVEEV